jgi:hypothetical protein
MLHLKDDGGIRLGGTSVPYVTANTLYDVDGHLYWGANNISQLGDITGVTAGSGLSGGGTTGTVTLTVDDVALGTGTTGNYVKDITGTSNRISVSAAASQGSQPTLDLAYPLTAFESTGIDDNATETAITVTSGTRVGIGNDSPTHTLHVEGNIKLRSSGAARIVFEPVNNAQQNQWNLDNNEGTFRFFTEPFGGGAGSIKMQITEAGQVGIGKVPGVALDVSGAISASGTIRSENEISSASVKATDGGALILQDAPGGPSRKIELKANGTLTSTAIYYLPQNKPTAQGQWLSVDSIDGNEITLRWEGP